MEPAKQQLTARDLVSSNPSKQVKDIYRRAFAAAKKDQDELLAKAKQAE